MQEGRHAEVRFALCSGALVDEILLRKRRKGDWTVKNNIQHFWHGRTAVVNFNDDDISVSLFDCPVDLVGVLTLR